MSSFVVRPRLVRLLVIVGIAGLVAGHLVVTVGLRSDVDLFDLNAEGNLGTWWSSAAMAAVASSCAVLARVDAASRRTGWRIAAAVFLLGSLDEVAQLHDRVGKLVGNGEGPFYFGWVLPGAAAGVVLLVALVRFARRLDRPLAVRLALGAALFLVGAVGMEMVGGRELQTGLVADRDFVEIERSRRYLLTAGVEEALELVGEGVLLVSVTSEIARRLDPNAGRTGRAVVVPLGELLTPERRSGLGR